LKSTVVSEKDNSVIPFFVIAISLILLDQITKAYFKGFELFGISHQGYRLYDSDVVIPGVLNFTFVENPGMAFGIEFGEGKLLLSLFSIVASILLAVFIYKIRNEHKGIVTGFTLILSGAAGNMIDRVFYGVFYDYGPLFFGKVVDFIQVNIPDMFGYSHFPVFNIADSCVTIGMVLLFIYQKHLPEFSFKSNKSDADTEV
jgi:signal peptidase II